VDEVTLYTDGSCLGNPGPGGWAALLVVDREGGRAEKLIDGDAQHTTNNRMEITAVLEGLRALKRPCVVEVVTDSNYVVQAMTSWIHGWRKKGWRTASKKPVENRDLWEALSEAAAPHRVTWTWVRGHAGHPENERVDDAARARAEAVK
jgi:ribonuclease HI